MMWAYYDRTGRQRLGDEDTVIANAHWSDIEKAYSEYLDDFYDEVYIMGYYLYRPSELFRDWSYDDFSAYAREWFEQTVREPNELDLEYLASMDITPMTEEDVRDRFETQFGERRKLLEDVPKSSLRPNTRPPTPVERARQSARSAGGTSGSVRSGNRKPAKSKVKDAAKAKGRR